MKQGKAHIGTSGWQYPEFKGVLYPPDLPSSRMLASYATHFNTVEVNSSFYHFTRPTTFAKWRESAPPGFTYAVKANRYFTHFARLKNIDSERLEDFLESAKNLGPALGPILFQLPKSVKPDIAVLKSFLAQLKPFGKDFRFTIEFRHPDWHEPTVFKLLEKQGVAFCIFDIVQLHSPIEVTAEFAYTRLHGPLVQPYRGLYDQKTLESWAKRIGNWRSQRIDSYVYFDNTMDADAVRNAKDLIELLEESRAQKRAA